MIERTFIGDSATDRAVIARPFVRLLGNQSSTLLMLLALNLLLIVFFVVLNVNATTDTQKTRNVLASVQKSFSDDINVPTNLEVTSVAKSAAQDALRTSVSTAFASVLEGEDIIVRNEADRFSVIAPLAAFFDPETTQLRATLPVFNRIAEILNAPADGFRYEMIATIDADIANMAPIIKQAGVLAEDLLRRDFRATTFSVGLIPANTQNVTFTFQVLSDDAPFDSDVGAP
jgi:GGDEF domain-containing protein